MIRSLTANLRRTSDILLEINVWVMQSSKVTQKAEGKLSVDTTEA